MADFGECILERCVTENVNVRGVSGADNLCVQWDLKANHLSVVSSRFIVDMRVGHTVVARHR